ncbi:MAG: ABC transporter permease subunit [Eubacteriales bacterium]|nr:ABC transporter permease subunit [Eubacteriales bacterium]MDD3881301.1 ABC transporter permease subunit [Eubacteriales bacterium]MDD4512219.1 ABC transporter permease subunit [Eubacteriales bacterium]
MKASITKRQLRSYREFLYVLPFIVMVAIFSYYPLYGWIYSFFSYKPPQSLSWTNYVGLKWFATLVSTEAKRAELWQVFMNTFVMSGITLTTSWIPMLFAVFLNEIKCMPFRKVVQTVTTLPNFISWVLVYSIAQSVFNSTGLVNTVAMQLGLISAPIDYLKDSSHVYLTMWLWLTWKNLGWASIMYIAAIAGIDEELFEAARVDGASRLKIIWHITIPSLLPTFFVLLMINSANFLSNGMEQYYVFNNSFNTKYTEVLDLYVYNLATGNSSYSISTALSMFKSVISLMLLLFTNSLSKAVRGESFM